MLLKHSKSLSAYWLLKWHTCNFSGAEDGIKLKLSGKGERDVKLNVKTLCLSGSSKGSQYNIHGETKGITLELSLCDGDDGKNGKTLCIQFCQMVASSIFQERLRASS